MRDGILNGVIGHSDLGVQVAHMCSEVVILVDLDPEDLHHLLGLDDLTLVISDDIFMLVDIPVKVHILSFAGIDYHAVVPVVPVQHGVELLQVLIDIIVGVSADDMLCIIYVIYYSVLYILMIL